MADDKKKADKLQAPNIASYEIQMQSTQNGQEGASMTRRRRSVSLRILYQIECGLVQTEAGVKIGTLRGRAGERCGQWRWR